MNGTHQLPFRLTPAVKSIAIACVAIFVVQTISDQYLGGRMVTLFGLVPANFVLDFQIWQIFTYVFLHGDVMHLLFNMLGLVFVGGELEASWGTRRFLKFFFFSSTIAGVFYLALQFLFWGGGLTTPMVGASGGIYGLLLAYGILFGERVMLFMMILPMKAKHLVMFLAGIEFLRALSSPGTGGALSGVAHLGGMAGGFFYLWARARLAAQKALGGWGPRGGAGGSSSRRKNPGHLKLIKKPGHQEPGGHAGPAHSEGGAGRPVGWSQDDKWDDPAGADSRSKTDPKFWN